ncbi:L-dopachrome tautomerase-related protein [Gluconobacter morbifer]|uniref:Gluconolactonase n=1 Tax=Gluconobacter morbifer G707 TaxID=1088869 RepID=G6XL15_9PROT|nr:L-dopachrome tautomerase-related protein [Gluconobacter morbifer]EHH67442.1 hypothetical protein GMO_24380 [Gluconobacter morbifer G707]
MKRQKLLALFLCAGTALLGTTCTAEARESVDKGSIPSGNVDVIARFPTIQPSGIAILPDGRMVLGFPRSVHDHPGPRLAVYAGNKATPFPSEAVQAQFVSPLGMTVDAKGKLWVLDEGMVAGHGTIPGAQKLFEIDPKKDRILRVYPITAPALLTDSHLNDVRIDLTHGQSGTAFITDTSTDVHPGIIVVDLASGHQRRILADARVVSAEPGFVGMIDGVVARYDPKHPVIPQGGVDGIDLSADQKTLYWQSLSSRTLYSAPTAVLANPDATEQQIEAAVKDEGETGMGDGMATGPDGSLYLTDVERHGILRRTPDGGISIVAHDPRLIEPDGLVYHDGALYGTVGQWARLPDFHNGKDMEEMPYIVIKISLPK